MTDNVDAPSGALYSIPTICKILHLNPRHVRRWVSGYSYGSRVGATQKFAESVLVSPVYEAGSQTLITFEQMIEVMFIDIFQRRGVRLPVIRSSAKRLAVELNVSHPLALPELLTDNSRIYSEKIIDSAVSEGLERKVALADLALMGQLVFEPIVHDTLERVEYVEKLTPTQFWPVGRDKNVLIDKNSLFGRPFDPQSGIPTRTLYGMYKAGESIEGIAAWFKVKKASVKDAIDFEEQLGYKSQLAA